MSPFILLIIVASYLIGSVSSAVLISRIKHLPDPRQQGSKNPGATNVLRLGGSRIAAFVLFCDVLKGMIPVWGSYYLGISPVLLGVIAIAACLGHIYPIFFNFQGGKGVATALGAIAPIGFSLTSMIVATWLSVAFIFRYSSLASITSAILAPLYTWLVNPQYTLPVAMLCCLILFRHQDNMKRLLAGNEPKIGKRSAI
ncbi:glycerol-3-phosphate 1-O-acyltransferase PlsY [Vibrio sp. RC27]